MINLFFILTVFGSSKTCTVLPSYEFTLLSNYGTEHIPARPVLPSYEFTLLSNLATELNKRVEVLPSYEFTLLSNIEPFHV